jgi:hypothetical protein
MRCIAAACHDEFKIFAIKIVELDSVFRPPEGVEDVKQMQTLFEVKFYSSKYGFDLHFLHCERTTDHTPILADNNLAQTCREVLTRLGVTSDQGRESKDIVA